MPNRFGVDERLYTAVGRWRADKTVRAPSLVIASRKGSLHLLSPVAGPDGAWSEESVEVPELRSAQLTRVMATAHDSHWGDEPIIVLAYGADANRRRFVVILERAASGNWRRIDPPKTFDVADLAYAANSGFAAMHGGKTRIHWAARPGGRGVMASMFDMFGNDAWVRAAFPSQSVGNDFVVSPVAWEKCSLARLEGDRIVFHPVAESATDADYLQRHRNGFARMHVDFGTSIEFRLPPPANTPKVSGITPINDPGAWCHGLFVRTEQNEMYGCAFAHGKRPHSVGRMTGAAGGPAQLIQAAGAFFDGGHVHIFGRDAEKRIWWAEWPAGASIEGLAWTDTGERADLIEAPQMMETDPFLFVGAEEGPVDVLTLPAGSTTWKRVPVKRATELLAP